MNESAGCIGCLAILALLLISMWMVSTGLPLMGYGIAVMLLMQSARWQAAVFAIASTIAIWPNVAVRLIAEGPAISGDIFFTVLPLVLYSALFALAHRGDPRFGAERTLAAIIFFGYVIFTGIFMAFASLGS